MHVIRTGTSSSWEFLRFRLPEKFPGEVIEMADGEVSGSGLTIWSKDSKFAESTTHGARLRFLIGPMPPCFEWITFGCLFVFATT